MFYKTLYIFKKIENRQLIKYTFIPFFFVLYSVYYDLNILHFDIYKNGYIFMKPFFIVFPFFLFFTNFFRMNVKVFIYGLFWIFYCFYHVKFVSLIYSTAFIQTAVAFSVMVEFSEIEYIIFALLMLVATYFSIDGTENVMSYISNIPLAKQDYIINMFCLQGICYLAYYYVTLPKLKLTNQEKKMASYGKASSFIMHEMAKPLTRLKQNPENIETELSHIQDVFKISRMINDNVHSDVEIEEVSLDTVIYDVLGNYQKYIDEFKIELKLNIISNKVLSDKKYIYYIVDNLIKNAIEEVKTHNEKIIEINFDKNDFIISNKIESTIINEKQLASPMKSSKDGHMGVGLFISKILAEKMSHQIEFKVYNSVYTAVINF